MIVWMDTYVIFSYFLANYFSLGNNLKKNAKLPYHCLRHHQFNASRMPNDANLALFQLLLHIALGHFRVTVARIERLHDQTEANPAIRIVPENLVLVEITVLLVRRRRRFCLRSAISWRWTVFQRRRWCCCDNIGRRRCWNFFWWNARWLVVGLNDESGWELVWGHIVLRWVELKQHQTVSL